MKTDTVIEQGRSYKNLTYEMKQEQVEGYIDGIRAVEQFIYKVLNTERYEYPVYSFLYGVELTKLVGKERPYVQAELKRIVTEALLRDDRIITISDFRFIFSGDRCSCSFLVKSIYGELDESVEVNV